MEALLEWISRVPWGEARVFWPVFAGAALLWAIQLAAVLLRRGRAGFLREILMRGPALLVAAALFLGPAVERRIVEPGVVLLAVDRSAGVPAEARDAALAMVRQAAASAGHPVVEADFGAGRASPEGGARSTGSSRRGNPAPALASLLLRPEAREGGGKPVLVAGEHAIPPQRGAWAAARDLNPLVVSAGAPPAPPVAIDTVSFAGDLLPGEPVPLRLDGRASGEIECEVELFVSGDSVRTHRIRSGEGAFHATIPGPAFDPGIHVLGVAPRIAGSGEALPALSLLAEVPRRPEALLVSDRAGGAIERALLAQEVPVRRVDPQAFLDGEREGEPRLVVLDRVLVDALSEAPVLARLTRHLDRGGGLLFFPRETPYELVAAPGKAFLDLLPLRGVPPPPPAEDPEDKPEEDPAPGEPDPGEREPETREVKTLGLLLVIDASGSMREGTRLLLAIEAAIAATAVLHPEDYVGVIQFNTRASPVLELTKAGDKDFIADRISRIDARGGTAFGPALELAREMFGASTLGIRHAVLLSDGDSRPYLFKPLVASMVEEGITLSTVGCGAQTNEQLLSDLAFWGGGKFFPAYDPKSIPQIFTIEAERVIRETGARSRRDAAPPPLPENPPAAGREPPGPDPDAGAAAGGDLPPATLVRNLRRAPYLEGVKLHESAGLLGYHPAAAVPHAFVSVVTEPGRDPVVAHAFHGAGRVMMAALPFDGPWAAHLLLAPDYGLFLAQAARFLAPEAMPERFRLTAATQGRSILLLVEDWERDGLPSDIAIEVRDPLDRPVDFDMERAGERTFRIFPGGGVSARSLHVAAASGSEQGYGQTVAAIPALDDLLAASGSGPALWAEELGGELALGAAASVSPPDRVRTERESLRGAGAVLMLSLLAADFLLRKAVRP